MNRRTFITTSGAARCSGSHCSHRRGPLGSNLAEAQHSGLRLAGSRCS